MIRRPPRSTLSPSSAASDVYKRQVKTVYMRKKKRLIDGKKPMSQDERILQTVGEKLFEEMSFALKKDKSDVAKIFFEHIDNK